MFNVIYYFMVLFCFWLVPVLSSPAQTDMEQGTGSRDKTIPETIQHLNQFYSSLTSLECTFEQVTAGGGRERRGKGEAILYRPCPGGKMQDRPDCGSILRWTYTEPDPQIILNDGITLSIFNQTDNQLLMTPADNLEEDITYGLLSGSRDLLQDFLPQPPSTDQLNHLRDPSLQVIRLVPRHPHPQVRTIHLWFDKTYLIRRLVLEDHFGSITTLDFTHIHLNRLPPEDPVTRRRLLDLPLQQDTEIIRR